MLKSILSLEGIQELNKIEQKSVKGNGLHPILPCGVCEIRIGGRCENFCL
ncbi:hypothetical protein [Aquimarina gracilis]|nr:hypothetical protein [Aquimarina gracilis]